MGRLFFHQPLRQTEGLLGSLLDLMAIDLPFPDHTTISRRTGRLTPVLRTALASGPVGLVALVCRAGRTAAPSGALYGRTRRSSA